MRTVVLGAGVSGLTTAVVLGEAGHDVSIVARELEGTTSHAAAAIWFPYHVESPHAERWAEETRLAFMDLVNEPDAGVSLIDFVTPLGRINVPLMDTTRYLPYLRRRFGGVIEQREIRELGELDADLIVNCTGFGARALLADEALTPGYGVAIVVDRPDIDHAIVTDEPLMYVIPRTDDCILGGYDGLDEPGEHEVNAIVERCRIAVPSVSSTVRSVKRGIRPVRTTVRVEKEGNVIHNYGHGGAGFTVSWGCAREVERLVRGEGKAGALTD